MVSVDEDFFVLARVAGAEHSACCSPTSARPPSGRWRAPPSSASGCPMPDDDDDQVPAGDLDLLADLGLLAMELGVMCDDLELYPDEMLADIARRLGFGRSSTTLGLASADLDAAYAADAAALDEARAALATGDVPIGPSSSTPDGTVSTAATTAARPTPIPPATPRSSRSAGRGQRQR